jgi:NAD(P)-dependent dehydrogenase (short-subunit alcohol dehydrogenase family)
MKTPSFDLATKVAIVTGATKGMGLAISRMIARSGGKVVVSSRTLADCEALAAELNRDCGKGAAVAVAAQCAIENRAELDNLVEVALAQWGRLTSVVCNASTTPWLGATLDMADEDLDYQFESVFKSKFRLVRKALPALLDSGNGSIVFISSGSVHEATSERSVYACMRAAEIQLIKNLAAEFGPYGVRANAILPGLIRTEASKPLFADPDRLATLTERFPLRRNGEADEIAAAVGFLLSDLSSFTTGHALPVDGGRIIHAVNTGLTAAYGGGRWDTR